MKKARYIDKEGNVTEVISDNITPIDNEEKYKENLYCEDKRCNAKLFYVERQNPKLNRFFKTFSGNLHRNGCVNEINRAGTRKASFLIRGEGSNVSDEHIMRTLKDSFKNYKNDLNPSEKKNQLTNSGGKKKKRKSTSVTDDSSDVIAVTKESPNTNGVDIQLNGEKEPNIHRNEVSRMIVNKDEPFKEIHGLVDSIYENDGEIYLNVRGTHGGKCRIYFGTPFKTQHQQEYQLLHLIKEYILKCLVDNIKIQLHCFGELKENNQDISVQIYSYKHILIDGHAFYKIIQLVRGFNV
ncbi:hypothetical protein SAMN02746066_03558 [Anaerosporobacter mobilis DSM 15930]|jgi:hypothetical protein|uniref:Uncharacterized protein n=1 Tax=Anaerosporobacter mobilis DSM 15930 TaxID=1120996 RepID=A0A1M7M205_9FIRM|nr:hypothetical protein [Anaerosporobacter mobilis]SHM84623.1 hypothetical protein SAMN02746066_03558 [Anaerosporobacter mobilis DSM 15930]